MSNSRNLTLQKLAQTSFFFWFFHDKGQRLTNSEALIYFFNLLLCECEAYLTRWESTVHPPLLLLNIWGHRGEDKAIFNTPTLDSSCSRIVRQCRLSCTQRSATLTQICCDWPRFTHTLLCCLMGAGFKGGAGGGGHAKMQGSQVGPLWRRQHWGFEMSGGDDMTEPPNHLHHHSCVLSSVSVCVHHVSVSNLVLCVSPSASACALVSKRRRVTTDRGVCVWICGDKRGSCQQKGLTPFLYGEWQRCIAPSKLLRLNLRSWIKTCYWISNLARFEEWCSITVSGKQSSAMAAVETILLGSLRWCFHPVVFLSVCSGRGCSCNWMEVEKLPGPSHLSAARIALAVPGLHVSHATSPPIRSGWPKCYQTWIYHADPGKLVFVVLAFSSFFSNPTTWMFLAPEKILE